MAGTSEWWKEWNFSYLPDVYGPVYGGHSIQEALYSTLEEWLPSYIYEINRQIGKEVLFVPDEYRHRPDYKTLPKNARAAILIDVPGTIGQPMVHQNFTRANWHAEVMVFLYGTKDWQETQALTHAYMAAIRACILQHRGLRGVAETTLWTGEEYKEGEHSSTRTTGVGLLFFSVTIGNATNMFGGPPDPAYAAEGAVTDPSLFPPSPPVVATDINVTLNKETL
jgi:hypothetical protein